MMHRIGNILMNTLNDTPPEYIALWALGFIILLVVLFKFLSVLRATFVFIVVALLALGYNDQLLQIITDWFNVEQLVSISKEFSRVLILSWE